MTRPRTLLATILLSALGCAGGPAGDGADCGARCDEETPAAAIKYPGECTRTSRGVDAVSGEPDAEEQVTTIEWTDVRRDRDGIHGRRVRELGPRTDVRYEVEGRVERRIQRFEAGSDQEYVETTTRDERGRVVLYETATMPDAFDYQRTVSEYDGDGTVPRRETEYRGKGNTQAYSVFLRTVQDGVLVRETALRAADGKLTLLREHAYEGGRRVRTRTVSEDQEQGPTITTYTYDAQGRELVADERLERDAETRVSLAEARFEGNVEYTMHTWFGPNGEDITATVWIRDAAGNPVEFRSGRDVRGLAVEELSLTDASQWNGYTRFGYGCFQTND